MSMYAPLSPAFLFIDTPLVYGIPPSCSPSIVSENLNGWCVTKSSEGVSDSSDKLNL